ncbi:MAG: pectin lyase [Pirellulaceae bacterium]|nr:MAG: pectin lyase [Pirellulaceae bacterium]
MLDLRWSCWLWSVVIGLAVATASRGLAEQPAVEIYVAVDGDDTATGTVDAPLASLTAARDRLRAIRRSCDHPVDGRIVLRGGIYRLPETFELTAVDSGTQSQPVEYTAADGEVAILSGGVELTRTDVGADKVWSFQPPSHPTRQIYWGAVKGVRARHPNPPHFLTVQAWRRDGGVELSMEDPARLDKAQDVELVVKKHWDMSRLPMKVQWNAGERRAQAKIAAHAWQVEQSQQYPQRSPEQIGFMENSASFLDAPGEWFWNPASQRIEAILPDSEDPLSLPVVASQLETLIHIHGVHDVRFRGLVFEHTTWLPPEGVYVGLQSNIHVNPRDTQSVNTIPAAIVLVDSSRVAIAECVLRNLGGAGVSLDKTVNCTIAKCIFREIAGNGVTVAPRGGDEQTQVTGVPRGTRIEHCSIAACGTEFFGSSAIAAFYSDNLVIAHNEIYALPYNGIHLGWYYGSHQHTTIEANHIHHVMQFGDDGGAIHTVGSLPGSIIRENWIHDVRHSRWGDQWPISSIYLDNSTAGVRVSRNVLERGNTQIACRNGTQPELNDIRDNQADGQQLDAAEVDRIRRSAGPDLRRNRFGPLRYDDSLWPPLVLYFVAD